MLKTKIIMAIFISFFITSIGFLFAQEVDMKSSKIYEEILSIAKQENWKLCFLGADENGDNAIKVHNFKNGDTSTIYKFSVNALAELTPSISNLGAKIGFWLKDNFRNNSLYIINTDGSNLEKIITIENGHWVLWSPDDKKIIFSSLSAKSGLLHIIDIRSKETKDIVIDHPPEGITDQALSPNGQRILYSYKGEINCYDFSTNKSLKIAKGEWDWFAWSPKGDWVAYAEDGKIKLINPDTLEQRTLVENKDISAPIYWLPNGEYIVYGVLSSGAEIGSPYVVRLSDKKIEAIPDMSWMLASWCKER